MPTMTISRVAKEAGIGIETVRFYEREGLLEQPARRGAGYREYTHDAISRIRFIKQSQWLGFTLREIKELLALRLDPTATRSQVREQAVAKLADIEQKIQSLHRVKAALAPLIQACDGKGSVDGCPILNAIEGNCHAHQVTMKGNAAS